MVWADFLGLNVQFAWYSPEVRARQVKWLKALGLRWVRASLHWSVLEPQEGRWDYAEADGTLDLVQPNGLRVVASVVGTPRFASTAPADSREFDKYPPAAPAAFAQRMLALARRYPQVEAWQIWNEPNIPSFWAPSADPEGYGRLLAPTVALLRSAAPDKTLVMAGMAYFSQMPGRGHELMLEALGRQGAFGLNLVVAYHPYTALPEGNDANARDFLVHAQHLNQRLRAAGVRNIWATEWGWSSYDGPVEEQPLVGEGGQAAYTLKRLALMAALDYDRIFLFTLGDLDARAGTRDRRYGLLTESGEPKAVYTALANFLKITGPRLEPADAPPLRAGPTDGLVSIGWRRSTDGARLWMFWGPRALTLRLPGVERATLHQPLTGGQRELEGVGGVTVETSPQLQILVIAASPTPV